MSIAEVFLPEFDHEIATTRKLIALIPPADANWKPHEKSSTIGSLGLHLTRLLTWVEIALHGTEFEAKQGPPLSFDSTEAVLAMFDENAKVAREAIASSSDDDFKVMWTLSAGGRKIVSMPRASVIRSFVLNHLIHHRGQLSVYLRLRDIPLPSIYGPTADNQW
jgi:uncharacterized damage-inducible protein DinB